MTKLPKLLDEVAAENEDGETVPDAVQSEHIDALAKGIPRIIALLPDILHRSRTVDARHVAALEEMTKDLLKLEERARPLLLVCLLSLGWVPVDLILIDMTVVADPPIDTGCPRRSDQNQPDTGAGICAILAECWSISYSPCFRFCCVTM